MASSDRYPLGLNVVSQPYAPLGTGDAVHKFSPSRGSQLVRIRRSAHDPNQHFAGDAGDGFSPKTGVKDISGDLAQCGPCRIRRSAGCRLNLRLVGFGDFHGWPLTKRSEHDLTVAR
jgi:hypothetical protein